MFEVIVALIVSCFLMRVKGPTFSMVEPSDPFVYARGSSTFGYHFGRYVCVHGLLTNVVKKNLGPVFQVLQCHILRKQNKLFLNFLFSLFVLLHNKNTYIKYLI